MVSAIILAAGESRRMGNRNKLLFPFGSKTLIEHILDTVSNSNADEVIVVIGHEAAQVNPLLENYNVKIVQNNNYREGMTPSIHAGVKAASAKTEGYMICLSDLPLIKSDELNYLINAFEKTLHNNEKHIVIPVYKRRRGNPVIFSALYRSDILEHKGLMGCKGIAKQNPHQVLEVEMETDHVLFDIDTIGEYNACLSGGGFIST